MKFLLGVVLCLSLQANAEVCGKNDDRLLSNDPKVGRLSMPKANPAHNTACTATLIGKSCVISAATCFANNNATQVEFNTPASINFIPQPASPEDTYVIDTRFLKFEDTVKTGHNWAVFKLKPNSITGLLPGQKQGFYKVTMNTKTSANEKIRVVDYGYSDSYDYPTAGADYKNYAQKVSYGYLKQHGAFLVPEYMLYVSSNTGPGSPLISLKTNEVIGISTHGGCTPNMPNDFDVANGGTTAYGNAEFKAAIKACLAQ